jgi:hypothetical protein
MVASSQQHVEDYLRSAGFNLLNTDQGFLVADKPGVGGDRDTLLVWLPRQLFPDRRLSQIEVSFFARLERDIERYPDARYTVLVDSLGGISRAFTEFASARGVKIRVPVQFFDAPFRVEESPEAASAIKSLRDVSELNRRVPQPFSSHAQDSKGIIETDLLRHLRDAFATQTGPNIRFVVGSAGAGKSVLFRSLFGIMYRDFIDRKNRLSLSARPIPFTPEHLRATYTIRTLALVDSFLRSDVAAPVSRETLEWMLTNSYCTWMFDGLDELYSGDPEFFEYLLELMTRPGSKAQILVCARDSLLSSNDAFVQFLRNFSPASDSSVQIYELSAWERPSKRQYAWIELEGKIPTSGAADPPAVVTFLNNTNTNQSVRLLSGLPYYCSLLLNKLKEGRPVVADDEFDLLGGVVEAMKIREVEKGVILPDALEANGLDILLETIAADYCCNNYSGTSVDDIRIYSEMVLQPELSQDERQKLLISLVQFPLFAAADRPGVISFTHELLAEYLFGKQLASSIEVDPISVATKLAGRPAYRDALSFKYLVQKLKGQPALRAKIMDEFIRNASVEKSLKVLLQLWLSSAVQFTTLPAAIVLEGRDLSGLSFLSIDASNVSFRHSNLTDTSFLECRFENAAFEGSRLVGTRFDKLDSNALRRAQFGGIEHFEYIYVGPRTIDDRDAMKAWLTEQTGLVESHGDPCGTALQLRGMFKKFVHDDGAGRRDQLPHLALSRGTIYKGAPTPSDCVSACIKAGFFEPPNFRNYVRRVAGEPYEEIVEFIKNWTLKPRLRTMIDEICPIKGCQHVPPSSKS